MFDIIWNAIIAVWTVTLESFKNTAKTIWRVVKLAAANIRKYFKASADEKKLQRAAHKVLLKTWAISAAIAALTCFGAWGVYAATIGKLLHFMPAFVLDAVGYLGVMLLLDAAAKSLDRMGLRTDIVCNIKDIAGFGIGAAIPYMFWICFRNPLDRNVSMLISCYIACLAYKKIRNRKAASAAPAPAAASAQA